MDRFNDLEEFTLEKNMIANVPLKYGKKSFVKERKEGLIFKFATNQQKFDKSQVDKDFIDSFRKINYKFSFRKSYKPPKMPILRKETPKIQRKETPNGSIFKETPNGERETPKIRERQSMLASKELKPIRNDASYREKESMLASKELKNIRNDASYNGKTKSLMKLAFREKILVSFKGSKILNVKIEGQLLFSGSFLKKEVYLQLSEFWKNPRKIKFQVSKTCSNNLVKIGEDLFKSITISI